MELARAKELANTLIDHLVPACERIDIAGSVRRGKAEVKDIEIVAVPRFEVFPVTDLLGTTLDARSVLDDEIEMGVGMGRWKILKNGSKYKQLALREGINLDLFVVTPPAQYGYILAIRTGPADYSHWLVTPRRIGGALPSHLKARDGGIYEGERLIPMDFEDDLFRTLGLPYCEPGARLADWHLTKARAA